MLYTGIDYHRKYSVLRTLDQAGNRLKAARIDHREPQAFAAYFHALPEQSRVVMEACWNWSWLYDLLAETEGIFTETAGGVTVSVAPVKAVTS